MPNVAVTAPFYTVLPDTTRQRVALIPQDSGFALPQFAHQDGIRFNTVTTINDAVKEKWNLSVTVWRCISSGENGAIAVFSLHNHDKNWQLPPDAKWVEVSELEKIQFATPEQRVSVLDWLASERDQAWKGVPWSSPDWFGRASEWITASVEAMGGTVTGEPIQVRAWAISCVLRVDTTIGTLYFKALPDFLGHATKLERYLSEQFPNHTIEVANIEPNEHWMMTREFSGPPPESKEDWGKIFRVIIEIQQQCTTKLDELLSFGCHDRRLARLPELLLPVLDELKQPDMLKLYDISESEAQELERRLKQLPDLCEKLAECGIEETLIHGDLWVSNATIRDERTGKSPVIFDWTDGAITHPFFDIYSVYTAERDLTKRSGEIQAHFEVWCELHPREKVQTAFDLSRLIAPFYYFLAWRHVQLNAPAQSRWELLYLLRRFVRHCLEASI
jgi:hypothetical protein